MILRIFALIFFFLSFKVIGQASSEKEYVILTFEMDRNKDSHGTFIYYWVAELEKYEKVNEYKKPKIYTIYLHEFYSSNTLEACCAGKNSDPYTSFVGNKYDFPENYSEYLANLRNMIKKHRVKIQVINKKWKDNHKETVTVYATPVKGSLCKCEFSGDNYLTAGDTISFPKGVFSILENYLTDEKYVLLFKDFADLNYMNTAYRK